MLSQMAKGMAIDHMQIRSGAGSESLLVAKVFQKLKDVYFDNIIDEDKYAGCLSGLLPAQGTTQTAGNNNNNSLIVRGYNPIPRDPSQVQLLLEAAAKKLHG
jgi:hypothetical protein